MRHESGMSISEIARIENVAKSLIKYWIEHADRLVPEVSSPKRITAVARLVKRSELLGWKKFIQLIMLDKKTIQAMNGAARVEAAERLKDVLMSLGGRGAHIEAAPEEVLEITERKSSVIVRNWAEKNAKENLADAKGHSLQTETIEATAEATKPAPEEANGATG